MFNKAKNSSIILIMVGVFFGILAVIVQVQVSRQLQDTVNIVTPTDTIGAFEKLEEGSFQLVEWPKAKVPEQALSDIKEITGKWSNGVLLKGMPVTQDMLKTTPGNLTPELMNYERLDLRYVPVPADALNLFGDNLRSGDLVDVIGQAGTREKKAILIGTEIVVAEVIKTDKTIEGVRLRMPVQEAVKLEQVLADGGKIRFWVTVPGGKTVNTAMQAAATGGNGGMNHE